MSECNGELTIEEAKAIVDSLPERDLLEQLAEKAAELSQAALKCIRAYDLSHNPTPISDQEAFDALEEESADVLMCMEALLSLDAIVADAHSSPKWIRWAKRIGESMKRRCES